MQALAVLFCLCRISVNLVYIEFPQRNVTVSWRDADRPRYRCAHRQGREGILTEC